MCGIAGVFHSSARAIDEGLLKRMCESVSHRGPDGDGIFIDQHHRVGLGHRRLSIVDLATGGQPMTNEAEDVWLVFNGEIYNYADLKQELTAKGYRFRTTSDTEAVIHMYSEYGKECFARLNGIFAVAIFDKRDGSVILARDHFGVKPLYYTLQDGTLTFGSEIKVILQDPRFRREMDFEALNSFLTFRYSPSPQTLFKNVKKLYPGHYLKVSATGTIELDSYWDYRPSHQPISEADAVVQYQALLERAVKRQMMSDVPVGLLLSGGVDSAVIGHLMQLFTGDRIKTFAIGFEGKSDYNELDDARRSSELIGSDHFEMTLGRQEYLDFFYDSFHYSEEPIAEMTIPAMYYLSRLASRHVKVALTGQGADELLAGYKRHFGEKQMSRFFPLLGALPLKAVAAFVPRNERLKRAAYASGFADGLERMLAIYTIFTPEQKAKLLCPDVRALVKDVDRELVQRLYDESTSLADSLSKILYVDARMSLSDNLLLFGDKMSMANSLEMRVPFLDLELIKFIESLPPTMKLKGVTHKYIHKRAVKKWLPDEVIHRKKRGFATPVDEWLQSDLSDVARDQFNDPASAVRTYFDLSYVNQMLDQHQARQENFQRGIFALLSFEVWHRSYFCEPARVGRTASSHGAGARYAIV
jgi:asparagine synthase (glutamine-hydrolysing)